MSLLSKWLGLDKATNAGQIPKLDRETTLWLAFKLLKPAQRAALRLDVNVALQGVDDPKFRAEAKSFLLDVQSAVNR